MMKKGYAVFAYLFFVILGGRGICCGSTPSPSDWGILPQRVAYQSTLFMDSSPPRRAWRRHTKCVCNRALRGEVYAGTQCLCRFSKFEGHKGHKRDTWRDTKRDTRQTLGNTGLVGILETPGALRWCMRGKAKNKNSKWNFYKFPNLRF